MGVCEEKELPKERALAPVLTWTWHYLEFAKRPPSPAVLQDATLRTLFTRVILDADYATSNITEAWLLRSAEDYFYLLRAFADEVTKKLPREVQVQYRPRTDGVRSRA